jgi:hypothetical protein
MIPSVASNDNMARSRANPRRLWRCLMAVLVASGMSTACGAGGPGDGGAAISRPSVSASPSVSAAVKAAEAFVALAQGTASATVPWAEQVTYYIGAVRVADLTPKELPAALRSCPPGKAEYEQRKCPVSPLKTIATMVKDGAVVVEPDAPTTLGCTNVTIPKDTATLMAATVRPLEQDRNCITDFAVTLFTDATGNVDTIQFTLDGP